MSKENLPRITNTASYRVSLKFLYDDQNDESLYKLLVPPDITKKDIERIIRNTHEKLDGMLDTKPEVDYYANEGRDADTLLWYINKKYGWEYKPVTPDISIELM